MSCLWSRIDTSTNRGDAVQIRHTKITNFRGIKTLDWNVPSGFVCIIGKGDSGKSTILDAIELALSPNGSATFDDSDFFMLDHTKPISIQVTVGGIEDVPDIAATLFSESNYGLYVRGYKDSTIIDEPEEDCEKVLTVELTVGDDLEPIWQVIAPGRHDPTQVRRSHLELFGAIKLGSYADRHFTWSKNSLMSRLLSGGGGDVSRSLAQVARKVRSEPLSLTEFETEATELEKVVKEFGVSVEKYSPKLDVQAIALRSGGLSLHDGNVPLKKHGTGTKRLVALALQQHLYEGKSIRLIDEIEFGLEPYRLTQLIHKIHVDGGQTLTTTHSPVVIRETPAENLVVFHNDIGTINPISLTDGLSPEVVSSVQGSLRKSAESFLSKKIIVCEGATEQGLSRALDLHRQENKKDAFSSLGIAPMDAGGVTECVPLAERLVKAGYDVAILCDSDVLLISPDADLKAKNIEVIRWSGTRFTEQAIFDELSEELLKKVIKLAYELETEAVVRAQLVSGGLTLDADINKWDWADKDVRSKIGKVASKSSWFKRINKAQTLGGVIFGELSNDDKKTDFYTKLELLGDWCEQ